MTVWVGTTTGDPRRYARQLLVTVVAERLGVPAVGVAVAHPAGGRPRVTGHAGLHVSVGHTRGAVAVAVTGLGPVGVDVEAVRPLPAVALARRWLPPAEADWVTGHPPGHQVRAFLLLWTAKEAMGKALGTGLRGGGLRRPALPGDAGTGGQPELRPVPDHPGLLLAAPRAGDDVVVAVACASSTAAGTPVVVHAVAGGTGVGP